MPAISLAPHRMFWGLICGMRGGRREYYDMVPQIAFDRAWASFTQVVPIAWVPL
ncbi:hypothetical protein KI387_021812, partial [Taxus chinensis]